MGNQKPEITKGQTIKIVKRTMKKYKQ